MKPWKGKDFEYLVCQIKNNHKDGFICAYDKRGNQICKVDNYNHGSITEVKRRIEAYTKMCT